jgi:hypothetical protein
MSDVFEDACRRLLGAHPDAYISVDIEGGQEVQIGDMTWDTEPYEFEVWARWFDPKKKAGESAQIWSQKFHTLPDLFTALMEAEKNG